MSENRIKEMLVDLGICEAGSIEPFYPRVRDREDVSVLRCSRSGVICLSGSAHMDISHYEEKPEFGYWTTGDRKQAVNRGIEDRNRRVELLQHIVANRAWLDVGTGAGGILDELAPVAGRVAAVEPQQVARESLAQLGYEVYPDICSVETSGFEVVTLFHVFEHLMTPLDDLKELSSRMAEGGKVLIEVPHANDFLMSFLDHEEFKAFTLWSEHLILHTRESLARILRAAGFRDVVVSGCQRYPLANHLHWLAKKKPGGHEKWAELRTPELDAAYAAMLAKLDKTDTLIATAVKA